MVGDIYSVDFGISSTDFRVLILLHVDNCMLTMHCVDNAVSTV